MSSVPWVTWTTGRASSSSSHQAGRSKVRAGGFRSADEAHRGRQVRAWVFEARDRRLEKGVDHLGLEVDDVAGKTPWRAGIGQPVPGEPLYVGQHEVLGGPVHGGVAEPAQWSGPGLERHSERCGVPAVRCVGHDADGGECRAVRPWTQRQRKGAEEHGVDHDAVGGEVVENGAQVAALAGQRAEKDPAQVVLHPPDAPLRRRLALGVRHHEVVGVVLAAKGTKRAPSPQPTPGSARCENTTSCPSAINRPDSATRGAVWPGPEWCTGRSAARPRRAPARRRSRAPALGRS